ncbi:putative zinc finger containing protein [Venturia nashicola]|uniref:Putative zinc finger containing protein n=1 Tax=Venturia nashicola TaxID=86259 RepID=A0A4Z1P7U6_9PEZI|nr:putative zinc finger containing protein [Venturia nashicola]TLD32261.1 putative zinc finger containing protein [Venturia nashicola]
MAAQHFDPYTAQDHMYSDFPTTTQSYPTSGAYVDTFENTLLSTIDTYAAMNTFAEMPNLYTFSHPHQSYSPITAENEQMLPPKFSASSESEASAHSTVSSAIGSPHPHSQFQHPEPWNATSQGLDLAQDMSTHEIFAQDPYFTSSLEQDSILATEKMPGFVDPLSLSPFSASLSFQYPDPTAALSPQLFEQQPPSPAPSQASARSHTGKVKPSPAQSPYLGTVQYHPYAYPTARRPSTSSVHSRHSHSSRRSDSFEISQEDQDKGICPMPDCGRSFKDLKAHMLTHQTERPEKCPIQTCEYHVKGFARKYDKNRHTLTHYKGTMVCGFCPGSGSAAEKSFNRADVFKRHLTSVHGVEQTPPNARRKSPIAGKKGFSSAAQNTSAGTCSTCSVTFANAQEFYEHLDDCVLRVVQQIDPAEGINQKNLASISDDAAVKETLEAHGLSGTDECGTSSYDDVEEEEEEEYGDNDDAADSTYGSRNPRPGKGMVRGSKKNSGAAAPGGGASTSTLPNTAGRITKISGGRRVGLTFSKGGVDHARPTSGHGRKKRKNYPSSWGCHAEKMKMKKRVLCVYDGERRLWKDDMMLDSQFEVRMRLPGGDGKAYVTDLDVQMLKRAEALHGATSDERGPWIPDNIFNPDVDELRL